MYFWVKHNYSTKQQPNGSIISLLQIFEHLPGALTVSDPTLAAMLSESFPPSTATPSCDMSWHMAWHARYSEAPSPGSLAAHIQLPLHLTSYVSQTKLFSIIQI